MIAPSFADIFRDNAYRNGMLPVIVIADEYTALAAALERADDPSITVDLERCVVRRVDGREIPFTVPAQRRDALLRNLMKSMSFSACSTTSMHSNAPIGMRVRVKS